MEYMTVCSLDCISTTVHSNSAKKSACNLSVNEVIALILRASFDVDLFIGLKHTVQVQVH